MRKLVTLHVHFVLNQRVSVLGEWALYPGLTLALIFVMKEAEPSPLLQSFSSPDEYTAKLKSKTQKTIHSILPSRNKESTQVSCSFVQREYRRDKPDI